MITPPHQLYQHFPTNGYSGASCSQKSCSAAYSDGMNRRDEQKQVIQCNEREDDGGSSRTAPLAPLLAGSTVTASNAPVAPPEPSTFKPLSNLQPRPGMWLLRLRQTKAGSCEPLPSPNTGNTNTISIIASLNIQDQLHRVILQCHVCRSSGGLEVWWA